MPKGVGKRKKSFYGRDMTEVAGKSCITIQAPWRDTFPLRNAPVRIVLCHPVSDHSLRGGHTLNGDFTSVSEMRSRTQSGCSAIKHSVSAISIMHLATNHRGLNEGRRKKVPKYVAGQTYYKLVYPY